MNTLKKTLSVFILTFLSVILFACNSVASDTPTGENVGSFGTYDALKDYLTESFDNIDNGYYYTTTAGALEDSATPGINSESDQKSDDVRAYSETNNQVEGVQEADRILTDGYHIYIVSGQKLFIINADTMDVEFEYEMTDAYLSGMYLYQGKLVVLTSYYNYMVFLNGELYTGDNPGKFYEDDVNPDDETLTTTTMDEGDVTKETETTTEITDIWTYKYEYGTKVLVFDVSDTNDVTIDRELDFEYASLTNSRMIDGYLYLKMIILFQDIGIQRFLMK